VLLAPPGSPVATIARHPIVAAVGPEFITGSTRMKSGSVTKVVLEIVCSQAVACAAAASSSAPLSSLEVEARISELITLYSSVVTAAYASTALSSAFTATFSSTALSTAFTSATFTSSSLSASAISTAAVATATLASA
jgi:hypothetical protein